jgi:uncharacterized protein YbjQ (UPF0145 family)
MGTAVRVPGATGTERPFTSLLSGQDFWKLWQAGFEPRGIAIGACTWADCTDSTFYQRNYNQEVSAYTNCFYEARREAMSQFMADLAIQKADGAVGVDIEYDFEDAEVEIEVSEGNEVRFIYLITNFVVMGNAIVRRHPLPQQKGRPLVMYDLRKPGTAEIDKSI